VAKKQTSGAVLARKERVVASNDMPGIPAGTGGKVTIVEGFEWVRYWVRFDNGVIRGSVNRANLARPAEWAEIQRRREAGEDLVDAAAGDGKAGGGDAAPGAAAEGVMVNGVSVPGYLIERSKTRRELLSA
jgi:hypothetical protein